jgi:hypothetical protein
MYAHHAVSFELGTGEILPRHETQIVSLLEKAREKN